MKVYLPFLFLCTMTAFSQGWMPSGGRSGGLLNASTSLVDNWAYFNNPGALGKVENVSIGAAYESRFILAELQNQSLAIALPTKLGVFSIGGFNRGTIEYRNFRTGIGYALKLAEHFSAGVQINYQGLRLPNYYGNSNTVTGEAGVLLNISNKWDFGFAVFNLGQNKLSEFQNDRYNTTLRIGTTYKPAKIVKIIAEVWKDIDGPISFKGGIEYEPLSKFFLRLGVGNQPSALAFGFGYEWKVFKLDIATAYHQMLGWSPQLSFTYEKRKRK